MVIITWIKKYKKDSNLYNNIVGTTVIKACSLLFGIITIDAYSHYFIGNDVILGVWLTVLSVLSWVINFDIGIGNGLRNHLVKYIAQNDIEKQKECISSAYILLLSISAASAVFLCVITYVINWNIVLSISSEVVPRDVIRLAIQIALVGLILQLFLKLIVSILYAKKKTAIGSLPALLTNVLMVLFTFTFKIQDTSEALIIISIAYAVAVILPLVVLTVIVFSTEMKGTFPTPRSFNKQLAKDVITLGGKFFAIQLLLLAINSTNSLLITHLTGPADVVIYTKYYKLFAAVIALYSVVINPIWSSVSESYYLNDVDGIIRRRRIVRWLAGLFAVSLLFVALLLQTAMNIFYRSTSIDVNLIYALMLAVYSSIMIMINSITCIENGINDLKPQLIACSVAAVLKIPVVLLMANCFIKEWISVVVADVIIMLIALVIQAFGLQRKMKYIKLSKTYNYQYDSSKKRNEVSNEK